MTPLHHIGEFLRNTFGLIPLSAVRGLFILSLVVVLIWVLRLPRTATTPPAGVKRWDENLKITAVIALVIQIVVYSLF